MISSTLLRRPCTTDASDAAALTKEKLVHVLSRLRSSFGNSQGRLVDPGLFPGTEIEDMNPVYICIRALPRIPHRLSKLISIVDFTPSKLQLAMIVAAGIDAQQLAAQNKLLNRMKGLNDAQFEFKACEKLLLHKIGEIESNIVGELDVIEEMLKVVQSCNEEMEKLEEARSGMAHSVRHDFFPKGSDNRVVTVANKLEVIFNSMELGTVSLNDFINVARHKFCQLKGNMQIDDPNVEGVLDTVCRYIRESLTEREALVGYPISIIVVLALGEHIVFCGCRGSL